MNVLHKHVEHICFRQCVTFWEHGQLQGWQPHFQPTVAKSSISTSVRWFAAVSQHNWEHKHSIVTNLGDHMWPQLRDQTLCFLHETRIFLKLQRRDGHDSWCKHNAELVERTVALRNLLLVETGCLEFQNGTAGMPMPVLPATSRQNKCACSDDIQICQRDTFG